MTVNPQELLCWIITEGMVGTENQCLGVAEALGVTPVIKRLSLRQPWKSLSPFLGCEQGWSFTEKLEEPWPDLLLASGRKSIAASRYIKRKSRGKTFTVQIQDPRISPRHFDLVALPAHDRTRGDNVITTVAAANRVTQAKLDKARADFADLFALTSSPRIAVLIGGSSKTHTMTTKVMTQLGQQLAALPGTPLITASRRTGIPEQEALRTALGDKDYYFWNGQGENPYFGMLAWADVILVTADSVSMLGDAGTTGKPVYMIDMPGGSARFKRFHKGLIDAGVVRPFTGTLESWSYPPLRDSQRIAQEILRRMGERA